MENIKLSHGSGGNKSRELVNSIFIKAFGNPILDVLDDSATIEGSLAFTTDSFVVQPIFFPGGDIGKLAVCGTVNDLLMKGAKPLYLAVAFIIGEGFNLSKLEKIVDSMACEAKKAGVMIVTGDTKVIDSKTSDTIYITTTGIGKISNDLDISSHNASTGDKIILSGTIADHGTAIMNARSDFGFKGKLESDCACLNSIVSSILSKDVKVLRDPTRGGVASSLNEIAEASNVGIIIDEERIPINKVTKQACALLGLDPLHIANEGKFLAFVKNSKAESILAKIKKHPLGKNAKIIGQVVPKIKGVYVKTRVGGLRPLPMLDGDQLPRIC